MILIPSLDYLWSVVFCGQSPFCCSLVHFTESSKGEYYNFRLCIYLCMVLKNNVQTKDWSYGSFYQEKEVRNQLKCLIISLPRGHALFCLCFPLDGFMKNLNLTIQTVRKLLSVTISCVLSNWKLFLVFIYKIQLETLQCDCHDVKSLLHYWQKFDRSWIYSFCTPTFS